MEFSEVVKARRSIRRYQEGRTIPREDLTKIVEYGMLAPNAAARRPWEFFVIEDREKLERVVMAHPNGSLLKKCSALIVVCGRKDWNQPMPEPFIPLDCAAAITTMLLTACDMGYGASWLGAYPDEGKMADLQEMLGTEGIPVGTVVLGYAAEDPAIRGRWEPEKVHFL